MEVATSGEIIYDQKKDIIIVGGGICGLATALALHRYVLLDVNSSDHRSEARKGLYWLLRMVLSSLPNPYFYEKGIKSVVLERSETMRATGAAIIIQANGWRALDQLGVSSKLRHTTVPMQKTAQYIALDSGECKQVPLGDGEMRCLRRVDLMHALADVLPLNTIRFGCKMLSIKLDPSTSDPIMQIDDGSALHAKVVIGCDGVNSTVAKFLGMKSTRLFSTCVVRGFTRYPSGHNFHNTFIMLSKGNVQLGRMSVNGKLVYWFVTRDWTPKDSMVSNDPKLIKQSTIKALFGFPEVELELIRNGDLDNLFLTPLRYRAPWELLPLQRRRFIKGAITVAGDAMHAMGPFIAQGGSACLEDAVVLARCFAQLTCGIDPQTREWKMMVQTAIDQYVKQRRMRVVQLSTQTFLIGTMLDGSSWKLAKFLCIALMAILFSDPIRHTRYDCGQL